MLHPIRPALTVACLSAAFASSAWGEKLGVVCWGQTYACFDTPREYGSFDQLAMTQYAAFARRTDGTLAAWGQGDIGTLIEPAANLQGVVQIEAGAYHAIALMANGALHTWGQNVSGVLDVPAGLHDIAQVAARWENSAVLGMDGTVAIWGSNGSGSTGGQLNVPPGLSGVTQLALGYYHALARKSDGTVVSWGASNAFQSTVPEGLDGVVQVAGGGMFSLALRSDGTVRGWGNNYNGQCVGTDQNGNQIGTWNPWIELVPVQVMGQTLSDAVQLAAGWTHAVALRSDGTVVAWGAQGGYTATVPAGLSEVACVKAQEGTMVLGLLCNGPCDPRSACYDPTQCDHDGDGWPVSVDCDDDDDLRNPGRTELCNGVDDDCDGAVDDACENDCDGNGVGDATQIATDPWFDLDHNGQIDLCEIRDDPSLDCNHNGYLDAVELLYPEYFPVTDCDHDGRIDACQLEDDKSTDCNGNGLFDACEIASGYAEDCDLDGVPDACAQYGRVNTSSQRLSPFGYTHPQTWTVEPALPGVDGAFEAVTLDMRVRGDFASSGEYFTVYVNGRFAGHVDGGGSFDCNPNGPLSGVDHLDRQLRIPMNVWNYATAAGGGAVAIEFVPSIAVDTNRCPVAKPSYIEATVNYTAALDADCNANGLLDTCEIELAPWVDLNLNGIPDECEGSGSVPPGCPGDLDRSGAVDTGDIALLLLEMNSPAAPGDPLDVDQSGLVDPGDVGMMLLLFGPCS